MALQIVFSLIFLSHLVNCTQILEHPPNALDRSERTSYFNPACGPSGYKCVNQVAYKSCDRSKRILHFCQMGSVCEDTGSEICIPQPPPCIHEGGFHIPDFCNKFYLCIRTGGRLKQYVGACEPGFEFSIASGNCTLPLQADCSVEKAMSTDVMKANRRDEEDEHQEMEISSAKVRGSTPTRRAADIILCAPGIGFPLFWAEACE